MQQSHSLVLVDDWRQGFRVAGGDSDDVPQLDSLRGLSLTKERGGAEENMVRGEKLFLRENGPGPLHSTRLEHI